MDMTIQIEDGRITTSLYNKPLALYQYIPPKSCHPPGVLTGLVYGQILCFHQLCSNNSDIEKELCLLCKRLINCGYLHNKILPLFVKGIDNATSYLLMTMEQREAKKKSNKLGCQFLFQECPFLGLCFSFLPGFLRIPWDSCFFRRNFFTGTSFLAGAYSSKLPGITGILRNSCSRQTKLP